MKENHVTRRKKSHYNKVKVLHELVKAGMRVQSKKKRGKVHIANFISAKRLPNAAGGQGGTVSPPAGPGLSPGGGQGG